ncbi:MAG: glycosyltransferase family 4 protein [Limnochordia bacterium]|jgi:glycosyltransferase involved in cell wall biosynthesis|nr:glycosyltransferase family 4 protein [Limnochordia bacterium]
MKVLFLSDFFLSGQTTHVLELAKQMQALGVDVHIAFGTIHSKLFRTHYRPSLFRQSISFSEGADLATLIGLARKFKPDFIHGQSSTLFQRAQLLSFRLDLPYILTCHGLGFNQARYRYLLMDASAVIAIGPNVAREIEHLNSQVIVIPNGVDTQRFIPPEGDKSPRKTIVYIGRLERKRIEALRHLAKAHQEVTRGPLKIISNWDPGIAKTIFKPWQADLVPHFQNAGIVAACGRTAREALSSGCAVLLMQQSYDGTISPTLVTEADFDFSGNLARYSYERLQKDLSRLTRSSYKLKKLQNWSRTYALAHLSSEQMAKKTLAVYQAIKRL